MTTRIAESQPELLALRMDDVGASSKKYEVYSNKVWQVGKVKLSGNWLFLKYMPAYKAWGPYRELRAEEWVAILDLLEGCKAKLTVAVTAAWVEAQGNLIPFPEKYPAEAAAIKIGVKRGFLEIANHGLTHCVLERKAFKPKLLGSNREFHREFGPTVDLDVQDQHLRKAQNILQTWLGEDVVTFVPPGNLFTEDTLRLADQYGLRYVSANTPPRTDGRPLVLGNQKTITFHDRELVLNGVGWLAKLLEGKQGQPFCFVRELAAEMVSANGR